MDALYHMVLSQLLVAKVPYSNNDRKIIVRNFVNATAVLLGPMLSTS
jgi:hypothetical protein